MHCTPGGGDGCGEVSDTRGIRDRRRPDLMGWRALALWILVELIALLALVLLGVDLVRGA